MTVMVSRPASVAFEAASVGEIAGKRFYPGFSKLLHWLTACIVLVMFGSGVIMKQIGDGPVADAFYTFHKVCGVSLLGLVLVRLAYRIAVQLAGRWRRGAGGHPVHAVLYGGLILVPLLGWAGISDYGARQVYFGLSLPEIWPEGAGYANGLFKSHALLAFMLIGLVMVHIGLALGDYIRRGASRAAFSPPSDDVLR